LAFLHAVILERKSYAPIGWSKRYEFSDADLKCAVNIVDSWLDTAAGVVPGSDSGLEHIDPQRISWEALRTLLKTVVYGGRLDNDVDSRCLASFVDRLFCPESFESEFALSSGLDSAPLKSPDLYRSFVAYKEWIGNMSRVDDPVWLGFAPHAERLLSARHGTESLQKWASLHAQSAEELHELLPKSLASRALTQFDFTEIGKAEASKEGKAGAIGGWVQEILPQVEAMLLSLPPGLKALPRTVGAVQDSLFRCFDRETETVSRLIETIRLDLTQLKEVCLGNIKTTNYLREVGRRTSSGEVPPAWRKAYHGHPGLTVSVWLSDLCRRSRQIALIGQEFGGGMVGGEDAATIARQTAQLSKVLGGANISKKSLWLGGLLFPTAYITASRQAVAEELKWSLDDLRLDFNIGNVSPDLMNSQDYMVGGIVLEGAGWDTKNKCLKLTEKLHVEVPQARLRWVKGQPNYVPHGHLEVPLFLDRTRADVIGMVCLPIPEDVDERTWIQRGVALILWTPA